MSWKNVHSVWALSWCPRKLNLGAQTLCMAILLVAFASHDAHADCPAAPLADPDDMVVSFLSVNGTQAGAASLLPSSIKEGMLVYDDTADKLKVCDGTNWVEVGSGSGSDTLASLSCAAGEIAKFNGSAWSCATDGGGSSGAPLSGRTLATQCSYTWSGNATGWRDRTWVAGDCTNGLPQAGDNATGWARNGNGTAGMVSCSIASGSHYNHATLAGSTTGTVTCSYFREDFGSTDTLAGLSCATNEIPKWDGTAWACAADGSDDGASMTGAVMAFNASTCPTGWTEFTPARGRFLRGIDNGAGNDPDGTRTPGNTQADELKSHRHATHEFGAYGAGGSSQNTFNSLGTLRYGAYEGGAETRPKNVAVIFCQYDGTGGLGGGGGSGAGPAFHVTKGGTNQTAGTESVITWSTEDFDTNNNFASNRFTPTVAGKYLIALSTYVVNGTHQSSIFKNTTRVAQSYSSATNSIVPLVVVVDMNGTTDYIEAKITAVIGTVLEGLTQHTYMSGALLGGGGGSSQWTDVTGGINYAGGKVGVGTATPSTPLEVVGTIKASSGPLWSAAGATTTLRGLLLENFDATAAANGVDIGVKLGGTEFQGISWAKETAWTSASAAADKDTMLQLGVLNDNVAANRVFIRADGRVGIGTTTPMQRLDVAGNLLTNSWSLIGPACCTADGLLRGRGQGKFVVSGGNTSATTYLRLLGGSSDWSQSGFNQSGNQSYIDISGGASGGISYVSKHAADHVFATTDSGSGSFGVVPLVTLKAAGNVGVGTTTPASLLQVAGGIQLGDDTATCPGTSDVKLGTLRFNSGNLELCTSGGWGGLNTSAGIAEAAGDTGQIQFNDGSDGLAADAALHWDNTNKRLGIGTSAATATLDLYDPAFPTLRLTSGVWGNWSLYSETAGARFYLKNSSVAAPALSINKSAGLIVDPSLINFTGSGDKTLAFNDNATLTVGGGGGNRETRIRNQGDSASASFISFNFDALGGEKARFTSAGNLGIGTTSPLRSLHVESIGGRIGAFRDDANGASQHDAEDILGRLDLGFEAGGNRQAVSSVAAISESNVTTGSGVNDSVTGALGFYTLPATNNLTNDTANPIERMRIDATGNVGIGTVAPNYRLDVNGQTRSTGGFIVSEGASGTGVYPNLLVLRGTSTTYSYIKGSDYTDCPGGCLSVNNKGNAGIALNTASIGDLRFQVNDITKMIMRGTTGNVGIGTTTPASLLQVGGGIQLGDDTATCPGTSNVKLGTLRFNTGALQICLVGGWSAVGGDDGIAEAAGDAGQIQFNDGSDELAADADLYWDNANKRLGLGVHSPIAVLQLRNDPSIAEIMLSGSGASNILSAGDALYINSAAGGPIHLGADGSGSEQLSVLANGNIGIGTVTPSSLLHLNSAQTGSGSEVLRIVRPDETSGGTGFGNSAAGAIRISTSGGSRWAIGSTTQGADNRVVYTTHNNFSHVFDHSGSELLRISPSGNVGIGTATPGQKLEVNGTVMATSLKTTALTPAPAVQTVCYTVSSGNVLGYCSSDLRLKQNVTYVTDPALKGIMMLRPAEFDWKEGRAEREAGFIAQDVKAVFPLTVGGDENKGMLQFAPGNLVPYIVKAVQELKADNDNLRAALKAANDNYEDLRREVDALKATR